MTRTLFAAVCSFAILSGCVRDELKSTMSTTAPAAPVTELQRIDVVQGTGEGITAGQKAVVHYTGWLHQPGAPDNKGKKFDSSRDRGEPFRFEVGAGRVIKGWDEGVQGMQSGGQRQLIIPANLAYGDAGSRNVIPPGATLVFDIELLAIE
jgi:FKBP-type peptidyl-prolyl cis-trans isomerase FkpA